MKEVEVQTRIGSLTASGHSGEQDQGLTIYWEGRLIASVVPSPTPGNMQVLVFNMDSARPRSIQIRPGFGEDI